MKQFHQDIDKTQYEFQYHQNKKLILAILKNTIKKQVFKFIYPT